MRRWVEVVAGGSRGDRGDGVCGDVRVRARRGGRPPERLTLDTTVVTPAPSAAGEGIEETWPITTGSQVGHRVDEVLFRQSATAVGRNNDESGTFEIDGSTVCSGEFAVDMTTIRSDQSRRDNLFNGRSMNVSQYLTSTFTLSEPIELGALPADGQQVSASASSRCATPPRPSHQLASAAQQLDHRSCVVDPDHVADWSIPNPSFGPAERPMTTARSSCCWCSRRRASDQVIRITRGPQRAVAART